MCLVSFHGLSAGYSVISLFNVPFPKEKRQYMQQTAAGLEDTRKKVSVANTNL